MKLTFAGGAMEIGGSCVYLRVQGKGILFDCGSVKEEAGTPSLISGPYSSPEAWMPSW